MNIIEVLDDEDNVIAYVDEEGTVGGTEGVIEGGVVADDITTEIDSEPTGTVTVLYDGTSWTKIASYYDGQDYVWKDFNGAYVLNRDYQFNLKFKDAQNHESTVYKVMKKGTFLFHEDGTWEKLEDNGDLPPYVEVVPPSDDPLIEEPVEEPKKE